MLDLLIIGGGPGGLSCAITARKRNLECAVVAAGDDSGWLAKAEQLDNYPGMPRVSGKELLRVFRAQAEELGAQFVNGVARQIQRIGKTFMTLVGNDILESKAVVLAMGAASGWQCSPPGTAAWRRPNSWPTWRNRWTTTC